MFLVVMELVFLCLIIIFVATQILIPSILGKALFPLFNSRGQVEKEILGLQEKTTVKELKKHRNTLWEKVYHDELNHDEFVSTGSQTGADKTVWSKAPEVKVEDIIDKQSKGN